MREHLLQYLEGHAHVASVDMVSDGTELTNTCTRMLAFAIANPNYKEETGTDDVGPHVLIARPPTRPRRQPDVIDLTGDQSEDEWTERDSQIFRAFLNLQRPAEPTGPARSGRRRTGRTDRYMEV